MMVFSLLLRPLLHKAPRRIMCILWLLIIARFLLPVQLESKLSLQPRQVPSQVVSEQLTQLPALPQPTPPATPDANTPVVPSAPIAAPNVTPDPMDILAMIWSIIAGVTLLYMVICFLALRHRIRDSVPCETGIWESDRIAGAFILGYIRPRVYLPVGLTEEDRLMIIAHEKAHIHQGDVWWKLLGMLCICIHWYNPLVWLSYTLMSQDIEEACDELVVRSMTLEQRKAYSYALLNSGKQVSGFWVYPVAFGEVNLKQRIKKVLSYRNPGVWFTVTAILLSVLIAVCFMTNSPKTGTGNTDDFPQQTPGTAETQSTEQTQDTTGETSDATGETSDATAETVHTHTWQKATCSTPKTCTTCGATEDNATAQHIYASGKCIGCGVLLPPSEYLRYFLNEDQTSYTVWHSHGEKDTHVVIPASYEGLPVTAVGHIQNTTITGITLPDSITAIGDAAFLGSSSLQSIVLPSGVSTIGRSAFQSCFSLTSITLSRDLRSIGEQAFKFCENLTTIQIPAGVTSIGNQAFHSCFQLTTITYEGTITQWHALEKGKDWYGADLNFDGISETTVPLTAVICSDGITPP